MKTLSLILAILLNAGLLASILLCVVKFASESFGLAGNNLLLKNVRPVIEPPQSRNTPYAKLIVFALGVRIFMFFASVLICSIFESDETFNVNFFSQIWSRWDSVNYTRLADQGFAMLVDGRPLYVVFFPLYPWCIRLLHLFIPNYYLSSLILSWGFYVGAVIFLYKLLILDFKESIAWKTIVLLSVFPFAFYLGSIHTESLSLFMMVVTFYYVRKHNWPLVMVFGILAALSRLVGSLVAVAAVVEYIRVYRPFHQLKSKQFRLFWKDIFTKFIFIPLIGIGGLIYLGINYQVTGNAFQFIEYQSSNWHNNAQPVYQTVIDLFERTLSNFNTLTGCIWFPELALLIITVALIFVTWKNVPSIYSVFLVSYVILSYSSSWLLSGARYMAIAFPLFLMATVWTEKKPNRYNWCVVCSTLLLGIYLCAFILWKQVM